jgi:hypothetical protein
LSIKKMCCQWPLSSQNNHINHHGSLSVTSCATYIMSTIL